MLIATLILIGLALAFYVTYDTLHFIISIISRHQSPLPTPAPPKNHFAIIIPAHNEKLLIGHSLDSIHQSHYPPSHYRILVIADNCQDETAIIAHEHGAQVFERTDDTKTGKPYAIHWLLQQIDINHFDAFIILDADTIVHPDFLTAMNTRLIRGENVIQGYFGVMNPEETWLTRLAILPGILKFKLHHPAKNLLHLSCPLAGNGMCFTREVFHQQGWNAFSIAENWEYYILLTLHGWIVTSAEEAIIYSQVAPSLQSGRTQRMRWIKGRLHTLYRYWHALLAGGETRGGTVKLDALIELTRPSHSMLFLASLLYGTTVELLWPREHAAGTLPIIAWSLVGLQVIYFTTGLIVQRAPLRTWLSLLMIPMYLGWKFSVSLAAFMDIRNTQWIKTKRHGPPKRSIGSS